MGAWTVTILLDLIALIFDVPGLGLAAGIATGLGVLAALATIAAGLMDWMDVDPPEKAVGLTHGILNTFATFLFAFSFLMRWESHWRPMLLVPRSTGGIRCSVRRRLSGRRDRLSHESDDRNAYRKGPDDFLPVFGVADLLEGQPHRVEVSGQPILLLRSGERIYAIGAVCSHYGAPLEEGKIQGNTIQCPWHFSRFALADGSVCEGPACAAVPSYQVRVIKDQVEIKLWR